MYWIMVFAVSRATALKSREGFLISISLPLTLIPRHLLKRVPRLYANSYSDVNDKHLPAQAGALGDSLHAIARLQSPWHVRSRLRGRRSLEKVRAKPYRNLPSVGSET